MGWTDARVRWRTAAGAILAAAVVVGPVAGPAVAEDTIRQQQWHLESMHAPEMWKTSTGQGVTVAVIDAGFNLEHPDLAGQFLPGKDFSGSTGGVGADSSGHGTGMASLIAGTGKGNGGTGAQGLAPGVKILPLKFDNGSVGQGAMVSSTFLGQIGEAITYAADQGAKVISISQGMNAVVPLPEEVDKLKGVIAAARAKGVLIFASAGNEGQKGNPVEYPGALPGVIAVGATDQSGTVTDESEHGPQVTFVAPGNDMIAACTSPTGYCKSHGTSDSTALASAAAALVWSVHPEWTGNQVLRVLLNTAGKPKDGTSRTDYLGYGSVRPRIALTTPGDPGPADVFPLAVETAKPTAPAPSASAPVTSAVGAPPQSASGTPAAAPKADASSGSGGSTLPIVAGAAAALVVVAGAVFLLARRRKAAAVQPASFPPPPGYQPPVPPREHP
ncbi:type VII secretion-associated serine protease mycosin [Kitasatospora sp. NPDC101183]|uniref:type VII secretion-associated serine protease mycosin n=1 Tax=Kitasatospora sp. NPDC101183 TaxID=3364100 RepID=UPI003823A590